MEFTKITYSEKSFRQLSPAERRLLFQAANVLNELRYFDHQLFLMFDLMRRKSLLSNLEKELVLSQKLLLFCLLAGKLKEAWRVAQKGYFATSLSKKYHSLLSRQGSDSLKRLKDYFSRPNLVETLRNNYGFHHDLDKIGEITELTPQQWEHVAYMPDLVNDAFFGFGLNCVINAVYKSTGQRDASRAFRKLTEEVYGGVLKEVIFFFHDLLRAILGKLPCTEERINLPDCPKVREISPLLFLSADGLGPAPQTARPSPPVLRPHGVTS